MVKSITDASLSCMRMAFSKDTSTEQIFGWDPFSFLWCLLYSFATLCYGVILTTLNRSLPWITYALDVVWGRALRVHCNGHGYRTDPKRWGSDIFIFQNSLFSPLYHKTYAFESWDILNLLNPIARSIANPLPRENISITKRDAINTIKAASQLPGCWNIAPRSLMEPQLGGHRKIAVPWKCMQCTFTHFHRFFHAAVHFALLLHFFNVNAYLF